MKESVVIENLYDISVDVMMEKDPVAMEIASDYGVASKELLFYIATKLSETFTTYANSPKIAFAAMYKYAQANIARMLDTTTAELAPAFKDAYTALDSGTQIPKSFDVSHPDVSGGLTENLIVPVFTVLSGNTWKSFYKIASEEAAAGDFSSFGFYKNQVEQIYNHLVGNSELYLDVDAIEEMPVTGVGVYNVKELLDTITGEDLDPESSTYQALTDISTEILSFIESGNGYNSFDYENDFLEMQLVLSNYLNREDKNFEKVVDACVKLTYLGIIGDEEFWSIENNPVVDIISDVTEKLISESSILSIGLNNGTEFDTINARDENGASYVAGLVGAALKNGMLENVDIDGMRDDIEAGNFKIFGDFASEISEIYSHALDNPSVNVSADEDFIGNSVDFVSDMLDRCFGQGIMPDSPMHDYIQDVATDRISDISELGTFTFESAYKKDYVKVKNALISYFDIYEFGTVPQQLLDTVTLCALTLTYVGIFADENAWTPNTGLSDICSNMCMDIVNNACSLIQASDEYAAFAG